MSRETPKFKRKWFRILSFDGGPTAGAMLLYLQKVVQHEPTFFTKVQLFAGTSAGSFSALFLASKTTEELANGPKIIKELIQIHSDILKISSIPNPFYNGRQSLQEGGFGGLARYLLKAPIDTAKMLGSYTRFLSGFGTLMDTTEVEAYAREHIRVTGLSGDIHIGDLPQKAIIVAFDLIDREYTETQMQTDGTEATLKSSVTWGPRFYHNLIPHKIPPEIAGLAIHDLVIRSSSLPLFYPIKRANVDGAVFANNPSMSALSLLIETLSNHALFNDVVAHSHDDTRVWTISGLEDILMFSAGGGDQYFADPTHDLRDYESLERSGKGEEGSRLGWGYWKWAFDYKDLLRAVKLLFNAGDNGVSYQCENLMGRGNFYRFVLSAPEGSVNNILDMVFGRTPQIFEEAEDSSASWAQESTWDDTITGLLEAGDLLCEEPLLPQELPTTTQEAPQLVSNPHVSTLEATNPFPHSVLGSPMRWELPPSIIALLERPFSPSHVLFGRGAILKVMEVACQHSEEELRYRLDLLAGYIYVGAQIAVYLQRSVPFRQAEADLMEDKEFAALMVERVYQELTPVGWTEEQFANNVGQFVVALWEDLQYTYKHRSLDVPMGTSLLWTHFIWMLQDEREQEDVTLNPLWDLLAQRNPYGGAEFNKSTFLDLFHDCGQNQQEHIQRRLLAASEGMAASV